MEHWVLGGWRIGCWGVGGGGLGALRPRGAGPRTDVRSDGRSDGRTDGRTDGRKFPPVFYRTSSPSGPLPIKRKSVEKKKKRKMKNVKKGKKKPALEAHEATCH